MKNILFIAESHNFTDVSITFTERRLPFCASFVTPMSLNYPCDLPLTRHLDMVWNDAASQHFLGLSMKNGINWYHLDYILHWLLKVSIAKFTGECISNLHTLSNDMFKWHILHFLCDDFVRIMFLQVTFMCSYHRSLGWFQVICFNHWSVM